MSAGGTGVAAHRSHRDKTIELNGRSRDNTRYRAFPAPNCFYQPFDMLVRRFISSWQRCNLVSTSKLSLLPHSIWSMTLGTNERKNTHTRACCTYTRTSCDSRCTAIRALFAKKSEIDLICCPQSAGKIRHACRSRVVQNSVKILITWASPHDFRPRLDRSAKCESILVTIANIFR